ncbi:MAG: pyridine nucleotide-disulfide oxidoreductase [Burkholderiales bacterium]|nr:MAG: pyridine nucleotide-disulfide oxidoreductase [Burkholderiales bacterium]
MHHGIKKLLLLCAGHAHVHVLASLAQHRPADLDVTVLTPFAYQTYSGMTPGFVAGHYAEADCRIALEPLVRAAGARWVQGRCTGIDTAANTVGLAAAGGAKAVPAALGFDALSIDTGAVLDRTRLETDMPGAAMHALAVRPIEAFAQLWPQVMELAQKKSVSLAVVGAGAAGIELVFAAEQAIRQHGLPGARFTLITGGPEVAESYRPAVQRKVLRQLKRRGITVLREACVGIGAGEVMLGNGARLACDVPLLAIGTHAPPWLQGSGLALSESGHVLVNAFQQSTSHPQVFAAGDVASRADVPHARSGVYAVRAGPPLAHNLLAFHQRKPLKPHQPPANTLNLLSCGTGHAIASYGPLSLEGAWAWRWKDRIDRGFIERYRVGPRPGAQASGEPVS